MQLLYQMDMRNEDDLADLSEQLSDSAPAHLRQAGEPALALAKAAWQNRADADVLLNELAPKWPVYRQPPVDRAILRLAYHEMVSGHAPIKVAINEAIELAKTFAGQDSPAFINGVLDKLATRIPTPGEQPNVQPDS